MDLQPLGDRLIVEVLEEAPRLLAYKGEREMAEKAVAKLSDAAL